MNELYYLSYLFAVIILSLLIYKAYIGFFSKDNISINEISVFQNSNNTDQHIVFLSHTETSSFLSNDHDNYVKNMSVVDLYARKVHSHNEYLQNISNYTCISFTQEEKQKLIECAKNADIFYKKLDLTRHDYYKLLNCKHISSMKWKFALTYKNNDKEYEDGLPHTREDIIFLSKEVLNYNQIDLTNTLIHEKLHIYQRFNKELMKKIIKEMNYSSFDLNQLSIQEKELIRSNPDLDGNIYYDVRSNKMMSGKYKSRTPKSISDVEIQNNFSIEHPYEKMAYDISGLYYKENLDKYKDI